MRSGSLRRLALAFTAAAVAAPAGAGAATTIGSPLALSANSGTCGSATFTNIALGAGTLQAPFDGVIVRWRMVLPAAGGSFGYKLRVLRPAGASTYTGAGTGPAQTAPSVGLNVLTLLTPLPVRAGDLVGVDCPAGAPTPFGSPAPAGSKFAFFSSPPLADASTRSPTNSISGDEELVNADVVGVPAITSLAPASGTTAGGTVVTISGSQLTDVTGVTFGGVAATGVAVLSDNQIRATAPAHGAGAVDVQAIDAAGLSPTSASDVFTYQAPPAPAAVALTLVSQSHRSWRAGQKLAVYSKRAPIGTTFSFALDQQASVSLVFTQKVVGRKVKGRCLAQTNRNRRRPACKLALTRGTLSSNGHPGTNKVAFQGLISRSKRLKPGRYTVTIGARSAGGPPATPKSLSFTIVK